MKINIKMFAFLQAIFSCQTSKLAFGWWSAVLGFRSHQLTHMALRMSIAQEYSVGLNRKHIGNPWKVVVGATRLWDLGICTFQGAQYRVDFSFSIGFNSILRKKGTFFFLQRPKNIAIPWASARQTGVCIVVARTRRLLLGRVCRSHFDLIKTWTITRNWKGDGKNIFWRNENKYKNVCFFAGNFQLPNVKTGVWVMVCSTRLSFTPIDAHGAAHVDCTRVQRWFKPQTHWKSMKSCCRGDSFVRLGNLHFPGCAVPGRFFFFYWF